MRITKIVCEYDTPEEAKEHRKKLSSNGLEFVSGTSKWNMTGKYIWECEYINTNI